MEDGVSNRRLKPRQPSRRSPHARIPASRVSSDVLGMGAMEKGVFMAGIENLYGMDDRSRLAKRREDYAHPFQVARFFYYF